MAPCVLFEDEHLLVVNKPAGLNTHAPSPYAGEGIYDWLRHREPRWAQLAIIHRLDKDTSGVMVFSKSTLANRSLTVQFSERRVRKKYLLISDRRPARAEFRVQSRLVRAGEKYVSTRAGGERAETVFKLLGTSTHVGGVIVQAEPVTGRTHQIRVHAAESGFPVLGDTLYGGTPAPRVCLHAAELSLEHPATGKWATFNAPVDFAADPRLALRKALLASSETNAFRVIHGASDGWPGWHLDKLGDWLLSQSDSGMTEAQRDEIERQMHDLKCGGAYHKDLLRRLRSANTEETSPRLIRGREAPAKFTVLENGIRYELSFQEGYSVGLFLDQRDNRRRLLTGHVAAGFPLVPPPLAAQASPDEGSDNPGAGLTVLNTFAYTCGFSLCAARYGARTMSLDLSKKYLEWGKRNFELNGLDPGTHDFIFGDVFDWLKRLEKKGRHFDLLLLDPPTFSQSKGHGAFRAEKDYGGLVSAALPLLKPGGVLFTSTNASEWLPETFLSTVRGAIRRAGRQTEQEHYFPQPPDFPVSRSESAYLKTAWFRVG